MFRTPRYLEGGMSHSAQPGPGFGNNAATIAGNTMHFNLTISYAEGSVGGRSKFFGTTFLDFLAVYPIAVIAGADTILTTVSINGNPGIVHCQANTGGYIAAIVSGLAAFETAGYIEPSASAWKMVLNSTGTVPTSANAGSGLWFSRGLGALWADATTTATATARTLTVPVIPTKARIMAASINDVATANQCTWTGTAGNGETDDGALGTARRSFAQFDPTAGASLTIISTYDVISTTGNSLAAAMFMRG